MNVLGIAGRDRDAAAAIAVAGRIVAAVSEESQTRVTRAGYVNARGYPDAAAHACLEAAGLRPSDLDILSHVADSGTLDASEPTIRGLESVRTHVVDAAHADAMQAAASSGDERAILVCNTEPSAMTAFQRDRGRLVPQTPIAGVERLTRAAETVASALGMAPTGALAALDGLSKGAEPDYVDAFRQAIDWNAGRIDVDEDRLASILAQHGEATALADVGSLNVRVQHVRRALAVSFTCRLAEMVCDAAERVRAQSPGQNLLLAGGLFANARLNTEIHGRIRGDIAVASLPEAHGRAIGAALAATSDVCQPLSHLALGPTYSNAEIKRVLDNCRLDYVYEPDRPRMLARVSKMLAQGKVVGWFQGAMGFGPRALGTRSVLCDPSSRYARYNVNEFYRQVPLDEPLPLVVAPAAAAQGFLTPLTGAFPIVETTVDARWHTQLVAALDARHHVRVHALAADQAPELRALLDCHFERTGVPALIETNLGGPGEPIACTPREAVRTVYSSAIDALVIGSFVLMKDHWLLRSDVH